MGYVATDELIGDSTLFITRPNTNEIITRGDITRTSCRVHDVLLDYLILLVFIICGHNH